MAQSWRGQLAVVTGAGSGIGRCLSQQLAARGADLALCDVNAATLAETAAQLRASGGQGVRLSTHVLDVGDAAAVASLPAAVQAAHAVAGRGLALFNNAGVALSGQFSQLTDDEFEWLMGINFRGVVRMSRAFLPMLTAAPQAHLVNVSSVFGFIAPAGQTAYCSAKFAVRGFTDALRHELEATAVRVVCVHPGGIKTNIAHASRQAAAAPVDPKLKQVMADGFVQSAPTTAEQAAARILQGLDGGELRIRIGSDAVFVDRLARLMPVRYWSVLKRRAARRMQQQR